MREIVSGRQTMGVMHCQKVSIIIAASHCTDMPQKAGTLQIANENGQTVLHFGGEDYTNLSPQYRSHFRLRQKIRKSTVILIPNGQISAAQTSNNGITNAKTPVSAADGMSLLGFPAGQGMG